MKAGRETPILVVDETPSGLSVRSHVRQLGFVTVDVVGTGQGALDRLDSARYGLVLSEWHLFDTDAVLLLKAIRQVERHRQMPFIVVTANNAPRDVIAARKAGVDRYILKPYSLATLRQQLETVLGPMPWSAGLF
jgi:two-component system chemotaxis response regulator CheY